MSIQGRVIRSVSICCVFLVALAASSGAQQPVSRTDDAFAESAWHLEAGTLGAVETWNLNFSREHMLAGTIGVAYGVKKDFVLVFTLPLFFVAQTGPDAWLLGTTWGLRWRAFERRRVAGFLEGQVGISRASRRTPPGGTRFNYLALSTFGITTRISAGVHLLTGIQWVHLSNNGRAGTGRNPDIEALGPRMSILVEF